MKTVAINASKPLSPELLKEADQEPVLLTIRGKPRYLLRSVRKPVATESAKNHQMPEEDDWRRLASSQLLDAYSDTDAIYDDL
jgi:hypothetical protein